MSSKISWIRASQYRLNLKKQFLFGAYYISARNHKTIWKKATLHELLLYPSNLEKEKEPHREQRRCCCHLPLPTRWSRRVRQSSASLWEAGASGTGKGMAGQQTHNSSRALSLTLLFSQTNNLVSKATYTSNHRFITLKASAKNYAIHVSQITSAGLTLMKLALKI